jgi:hypothetical protein
MGCKNGTKAQSIRKYICVRCNKENEQKSCGRIREICDSCKNQKNPCACGCGGFVKAAHNNSKFISGHNTNLLTKEELKKRNKKAAETRLENYGTYSLPEEVKKKISDSVKKRYEDPAYKEKFLQANRNRRPFSEQARANMSAARNTPKMQKMLAEAMKQKWLDGKFDDRKDYSKQEVSVAPALNELGYKSSAVNKKFYITYNGRTKVPDFYDYKNKRVLEIFGTWWHRDRILEDGKQHETPEELIDWYRDAGWECIVLWEDEVDAFVEGR